MFAIIISMHKKQITIPCMGYALAADIYEQPGAEEMLLVFLGYGSRKASNANFVSSIIEQTHMNALVVDFSGHGESPFDLNDTRPAQHVLEAITIFDQLRNDYASKNINILGTSYGAYIAAHLTKYRAFGKLVLRTPAIYEPIDFYSLHSDIDKIAVYDYRSKSQRVEAHPLFKGDLIFKGETLIVIHENDECIPKETIDAYKKEFSADTYLVKGFKHAMRDPSNPVKKFAEYQEFIAKWLCQR